MAYRVSDEQDQSGYNFADVHDGAGAFVGRVVHVMPSDTWRPDAGLETIFGPTAWTSLAAAKAEIEGKTE